MAQGRERGRGGFTLLEIILAIALIGLLAATVLGISGRLLESRAVRPDDVFWKAVQAARKEALRSGSSVRLSFDDTAKAFTYGDGASVRTMPIPGATLDVGVEFIPEQSGGSAELIGGVLVATGAMPSVTFFADGTCTPFIAQIRAKGGAHTISIDPWTCAKELTPSSASGTSP